MKPWGGTAALFSPSLPCRSPTPMTTSVSLVSQSVITDLLCIQNYVVPGWSHILGKQETSSTGLQRKKSAGFYKTTRVWALELLIDRLRRPLLLHAACFYIVCTQEWIISMLMLNVQQNHVHQLLLTSANGALSGPRILEYFFPKIVISWIKLRLSDLRSVAL